MPKLNRKRQTYTSKVLHITNNVVTLMNEASNFSTSSQGTMDELIANIMKRNHSELLIAITAIAYHVMHIMNNTMVSKWGLKPSIQKNVVSNRLCGKTVIVGYMFIIAHIICRYRPLSGVVEMHRVEHCGDTRILWCIEAKSFPHRRSRRHHSWHDSTRDETMGQWARSL